MYNKLIQYTFIEYEYDVHYFVFVSTYSMEVHFNIIQYTYVCSYVVLDINII